MKIKAIALDLDGTLLTSDKKISDINKEVLKYLENKGVKYLLLQEEHISQQNLCTRIGNR